MTVKNKKEYAPIRQIEDELIAFYDYCKDQNLSDEEINQICAPLQSKTRRFLRSLILVITIVLGTLSALAWCDNVSWHYSAIGRIMMIKLLPYYNWHYLKHERCFIKSKTQPRIITEPNCYFCETVEDAFYSENNDAEYLKKNFIELDTPIVFPHDIEYNGSLALTDDYTNSIPCRLATNLPFRLRERVGNILDSAAEHNRYFLHFQNCDFYAVKEFRLTFPRPKFFADEMSPVQYSWILASRDYKTPNFKILNLSDRLGAIVQLAGSNELRLYPVRTCKDECTMLEITLHAGDAIIFTELWELEYKPGHNDGDNLAVIFEAHL